jgi:hypothetical protein
VKNCKFDREKTQQLFSRFYGRQLTPIEIQQIESNFKNLCKVISGIATDKKHRYEPPVSVDRILEMAVDLFLQYKRAATLKEIRKYYE